MPRKSPPFFRYSYIIDGTGAVRRIRGKTRYGELIVEGFFCGFHTSHEEVETLISKVQEWYKVLAPSWWAPPKVGEEEVSIFSHETKGIGFYHGHIHVTIIIDGAPYVDERLVQKIHLRRRLRGRSFFESAVKFFVRFRRR